MSRKSLCLCAVALVMIAVVACRKPKSQELVVKVPAGFGGNFVIEMGVRDAAPLPRNGDGYVLTLPHGGKFQTSTLLDNPHVTFKNGSEGKIWGYSQRTFTTGDGISVGGRIEFFVGTQREFDAEQNKKNKSDGLFTIEWSPAGA